MRDLRVTHGYSYNDRKCVQEVSDTHAGLFHRLVHKESGKVGRWVKYDAPAVMVIISDNKKIVEIGLTPCYGSQYSITDAESFLLSSYPADFSYEHKKEATIPKKGRIAAFLEQEAIEAMELAELCEGRRSLDFWGVMSKLVEYLRLYKRNPSTTAISNVLVAASSLKYIVLRSWSYTEQHAVQQPHKEAISNPYQDDGFGKLIPANEIAYVLHFMYDGIEGDFLTKAASDNKELFYHAN